LFVATFKVYTFYLNIKTTTVKQNID